MPDGKCSRGRDGNGGMMMKAGVVWTVCSLPEKASGAPERRLLSFPIRALLRCWGWGHGDAMSSDPWAPGPRSAQAPTTSTFRRPGGPTLRLGQGSGGSFTQHLEPPTPCPNPVAHSRWSQVALGTTCPGDCWQCILSTPGEHRGSQELQSLYSFQASGTRFPFSSWTVYSKS